jgi:hypothetical protein
LELPGLQFSRGSEGWFALVMEGALDLAASLAEEPVPRFPAAKKERLDWLITSSAGHAEAMLFPHMS